MTQSLAPTIQAPDQLTGDIAAFLQSIGIAVQFGELPAGTFLPGISIEAGVLCIDPVRMLYPGDLLHEAGHLAVVPAAERSSLNCDTLGQRPQREAEEMMAIAWSYAAAMHLGIDPLVVFHEHGYKGGGENILSGLRNPQNPIGAPMLQYHGMCAYGKLAAEQGAAPYPAMLRWTLD